MSKSTYTYNNGLGCGCSCSKSIPGLGESPVASEVNPGSTQTKKDLVKTARDYINHEIPLKYKAGAMLLGFGFLWIRSRKR